MSSPLLYVSLFLLYLVLTIVIDGGAVAEELDGRVPSHAVLLAELRLHGGVHLRQPDLRVLVLQRRRGLRPLGGERLAVAAPWRVYNRRGSVSGQSAVSQRSVCGPSLVSCGLVRCQSVVSRRSVSGQSAVNGWQVTGQCSSVAGQSNNHNRHNLLCFGIDKSSLSFRKCYHAT